MEISVATGSKTSPRKLPPIPVVDKDNRTSEKSKISSPISNVSINSKISKSKKGLSSDLDENSEAVLCKPSVSGSEHNGDVEVKREHNVGKKDIKSRIKEVLSKDANEVTDSENDRPKRIQQSGNEIRDFAPQAQDKILSGHHQGTNLHLDYTLPAESNVRNNKIKIFTSTTKHPNVSTEERQSETSTFTGVDTEGQNPTFTPRKLKKRKRNKQNNSMTRLGSDFCNKSILETTDMSVLESDISECEYPVQRQCGIGLNLNQEICNISHPVNKLYVEQERGFTAIEKNAIVHSFPPTYSPRNQTELFSSSATGLAAHSQKLFQRFSVLSHGFLAGVALWQCVTVFQIGPPIFDASDFISHYATLAKPFQTMFYFLLSVSMLSAFDRYDIVCPNWSFLYNTSILKSGVLAILIYCVTLILSLCITNIDDKLALYVHNNNATSWITSKDMDVEGEVVLWRNLNLARCIGAIISWLLLSFQADKGKLQGDLEEMCEENYRES